jgi:HSP20 family protein
MSKGLKNPPPSQPKKGGGFHFVADIGKSEGGHETLGHIPHADMYSTDKEVVVEVELPGVKKEEIELTVYRNTITVRTQKYECFEGSNVTYICMERSFGRIFKTIEIPAPVDSGRIKASYSDGILRISAPRVEEKRGRPKKIEIE